MRPRPSAQAPAEYHADGARHKRQTYSFRAHGRIADRIFRENGSDRLAEYSIRALRAAVKSLHDDADERNRWADGVADRRLAAARIPSEEALRREPQSRNVMLSLHECERGGRNLDDVGAALRV